MSMCPCPSVHIHRINDFVLDKFVKDKMQELPCLMKLDLLSSQCHKHKKDTYFISFQELHGKADTVTVLTHAL